MSKLKTDDKAQAGSDRDDASVPTFEGLPQIDFATFVMSLASSVLMHLGELDSPDEPGHRHNLPLAKQTIDILGILAEKTRGNLTDDENNLLTHVLYDLRMKYLALRKQAGSSNPNPSR